MKDISGASASALIRFVPRVVVAALAVTLGLFILAPTVGAVTDGFEIVIDVDTVVREPEGSITELEVVAVPSEFAGQPCQVTAVSTNQESVHDGNDLIVDSGGSQVVLPDVEAEPLGTVEGEGQLVLGSTIVVSLRMGEDGVFSAGIDVLIDCTPPTPPTTPPTVPPTVPPTTPPPVIDVTTTEDCNLATAQFVISAINTGEVDLAVEFVWDSGALSETLSPGETLSQVIPADESYAIEVFGPDEEQILRETGDAESCDEVSPTSITSPPPSTAPPSTAPATTAEVLSSDTLAVTGAESGTPALLALALIGIGALALVATRRAED